MNKRIGCLVGLLLLCAMVGAFTLTLSRNSQSQRITPPSPPTGYTHAALDTPSGTPLYYARQGQAPAIVGYSLGRSNRGLLIIKTHGGPPAMRGRPSAIDPRNVWVKIR